MDKISIRGLEVFASHGCFPQEKTLGQKFLINADLFMDLQIPGMTDNLEDSVNYADVCSNISEWMRKKTYNLIETAADALARNILLRYPQVNAVTVEIEKPHAPAAFHFDTVLSHVERKRHTVFLGLGSNVGNREENIADAIETLDGRSDISIKNCSQLYETEPYGYTDQPMFINACARAETFLEPRQLLKVVKAVERGLGREKAPRWGPRVIDIDILLYDNLILDSEDLHIPHIDMPNREFVLRPLAEIAGYVRHPYLCMTVDQMLKALLEKEAK